MVKVKILKIRHTRGPFEWLPTFKNYAVICKINGAKRKLYLWDFQVDDLRESIRRELKKEAEKRERPSKIRKYVGETIEV